MGYSFASAHPVWADTFAFHVLLHAKTAIFFKICVGETYINGKSYKPKNTMTKTVCPL